jgi:hypothetical protein
MVTVAGAVLCLGHLLREQPGRDDAESTDHVAQGVLQMLGLPGEEASEICQRRLPHLDDLPLPHQDR